MEIFIQKPRWEFRMQFPCILTSYSLLDWKARWFFQEIKRKMGKSLQITMEHGSKYSFKYNLHIKIKQDSNSLVVNRENLAERMVDFIEVLM